MLNKESIIQTRQYQQMILKKLNENHKDHLHTIAEVDTGMGKRVLTYLLIREVLPTQRILLLLHSTTSFIETIHYFKEIYGGFIEESEFQFFSSKTPVWLRTKILESSNARVIASTPQTFFNAFNKLSSQECKFDVILINEIDKVVRRHGDSRLLIFPYNKLIPYFVNSGAWIVGMTGTLRDNHIFYNNKADRIEIQSELLTLDSRIPDLYIITMESLLKETNISEYIKYTLIQRFPVKCSTELKIILDLIDQGIKDLRENIIEETLDENPSLIDTIPKNQLALVSGMLNAGDSQKYQGLLLTRKYCTAMQPMKFRKFLFRLKKFGITKEMINSLPRESSKIQVCIELIQDQPENAKTVILCSYLDTAHLLKEKIEKVGIKSFIVTGEVRNKGEVLKNFKEHSKEAVLVMTSVGERDIDIPHAKLLIVYDIVNTVKTMYQRMKRTRGGLVLCLFFGGTFEEKKVNRLLIEINKRYPWSSIISTN